MNPTQTQTPTEDPLQTASRILLTPADIDAPILCAELARARGGVDWADIYAQRREVESWRLEEGEVKTGRYSLDCGVGLRALRGEAVAYAHSDEISRRAVSQFAAVARAAKLGQSKTASVGLPSPPPAKSRYAARDPLADSSSAQKIAVLQKLDSFLRAADSRVENVIAGLVAARDIVLVARADGRVAADVRPLVRLSVEVVVRRKNRRERGHGGCGGRVGIEFFTDESRRRNRPPRLARGGHATGRARGAGRGDAGGVGRRLGRHFAARGGRARLGGRLQPQRAIGVFGAGGRARGVAASHGRRRRDFARSPRLAFDRRRRPALGAQHADRKRNFARLFARHAKRAPDERRPDRQRAARILRLRADAADDEHFYAGGRISAGRDRGRGQARDLRG